MRSTLALITTKTTTTLLSLVAGAAIANFDKGQNEMEGIEDDIEDADDDDLFALSFWSYILWIGFGMATIVALLYVVRDLQHVRWKAASASSTSTFSTLTPTMSQADVEQAIHMAGAAAPSQQQHPTASSSSSSSRRYSNNGGTNTPVMSTPDPNASQRQSISTGDVARSMVRV